MKKILSFLLALALCAGLLAGCGSKPTSSAAGSGAASGAEEVTLRLLSYDHTLDEVLKAFEASHPGVKVKVDIQTENNSTEFLKKLDLLQLSGDTYDVVAMPSYGQYAMRAQKGFWEPLDVYYEKAGIDPDTYYTVDTAVDGAHYGVPGTPRHLLCDFEQGPAGCSGPACARDGLDLGRLCHLCQGFDQGQRPR